MKIVYLDKEVSKVYGDILFTLGTDNKTEVDSRDEITKDHFVSKNEVK